MTGVLAELTLKTAYRVECRSLTSVHDTPVSDEVAVGRIKDALWYSRQRDAELEREDRRREARATKRER